MIFQLLLKLEISYKSFDILKDFGFVLEDFFEGYIFENFHNSSFALMYCKWQGHNVMHPLFLY
jgi:hypothetical protein